MNESELRKQSDMTYWLPKLCNTNVPVPYTKAIDCFEETIDEGTIHELTVNVPKVERVREAVLEVGGPSAFIRTSQASDKHQLQSASKIDYLNETHIQGTIYSLGSSMKTKWGVPEPECYYVREWLNLEHNFTAFDNLPIAQEVRFFIDEGEIDHHGFYWPEDAIRKPDKDNWKTLLEDTKKEALESTEHLENLLESICEEFSEGYWSVDFAKTENDGWYCIDMARGELSWDPAED